MLVKSKNIITIDLRMINSSGIGTYIQNLIPKVILSFHILFVMKLTEIYRTNQNKQYQTLKG
jgi:hypothetical protein